MLGFIFFFSFCTLSVLLYGCYSIFFGRSHVMQRLQHYLNPDKNMARNEKDISIPWREGLHAVGKTLGKSKLGGKYLENLENQLIQGHIQLKPEEFIAIEFILSLFIFLMGIILAENVILALLISLSGFFIPVFYMKTRKKNILKKIDQQLPDTIMLISNSLKAGHSFMQAINVASKELPPPISIEFQQLIKEVSLGVSTEKGLESLSNRVQSEDLQLVILAVMIQRQIGGNLSEILDNISDTIRARIKVKGEISILTAQGRLSGLIISIIPVALGFALYMINPSHMTIFFTQPIGWAMLGTAIGMEVVGILFIKKIIRIEV